MSEDDIVKQEDVEETGDEEVDRTFPGAVELAFYACDIFHSLINFGADGEIDTKLLSADIMESVEDSKRWAAAIMRFHLRNHMSEILPEILEAEDAEKEAQRKKDEKRGKR
jgi:hypothetical protein